MQRAALSVLVLVGLVTVAGCNAFNGGSDTPMVTPMDVPTDEQTPPLTPNGTRQLPGQCISSLPDIGVANASALVAAHNATLWNASFTVREIETATFRNGLSLPCPLSAIARRVERVVIGRDRNPEYTGEPVVPVLVTFTLAVGLEFIGYVGHGYVQPP
jgi:hypothetical protein